MNEQILRPGGIALAALVIGGVLIAIWPQYAMSFVRLVVLTVAAAAGLYAVGIHTPPTWWRSPFDRGRRARKRRGSDELARIRSDLAGWRQRFGYPLALPPAVLRRLRPLIRSTLEREGFDPEEPSAAVLSPLGQAVLASAELERPRWYRLVPPDGLAAANAVNDLLDELDHLDASTASTTPSR
jgi:hypothetical protein